MSEVAHTEGGLSPLKRALVAVQDLTARLEAAQGAQHQPIAIVGLACRFPGGANDPESFWELLREGRDGIIETPAERWDVDAYYDPDPDAPGKLYTRSGGFLDGPVDRFDARFFEIAPREALAMDPQQRLLLELAWESLENAGHAAEKLTGSRTGVFVGISTADYAARGSRLGGSAQIDAYSATGNAFSVAAGRISYLLGLQGPNLALDTACSSSLVAVALAVQSVRDGHSDLALAGGVNLMLLPETSIGMCKLRALAPDGRCKTFDARADGYVRGEGGGMVVLKRLSDALAAGDRIHAVIRGAAVNHDGRSSGLTVPNAAAQRAVIRAALEDAGLAPEAIDYVEAHGTGTELGDPIEIRALHSMLGRGRAPSRPLTVGSVKTNVGHLEAAAGMVGLIKLVLSLVHEAIPPHLHLEQPTPHVDWDELPLVIPTRLTRWPRGERPRIGGVSAFGFSGTNAHVLVEEAPMAERISAPVERPLHLLPLSAKTPEALRELASRYRAYLERATDPVADACFTAAAGRSHFEHRLAVVGRTAEEMGTGLDAFLRGQPEISVRSGQVERSTPPKIAFLFTGHGAQYVGMGRQLFETQPVFRAALEECGVLLRRYLERPLLSVLDPADSEAESLLLNGMTYSQPALFALEYALAQLWRSWGIEPALVLGHSVGEYAAAVVAGIFSLADGIRLVAERGRLMDALPERGAMVAVFARETEVEALIAPYAREVSLAAINAPGEVVISGRRSVLALVVEELSARGIDSRWLQVAQAGHSHLLDPILDEFEQVAAGVQYQAPRVPLISCTTARPVTAAEIGDPAYWRRHLRQPVRFAAALERLHAEGCEVFVETGPHPALLSSAQQCRPEDTALWLPSLRRSVEDWPQVLDSLAALYTAGARPDWARFDQPYSRQKVALPTYPFQGKRYWLAERPAERVRIGAEESTLLSETADWLYQLEWRARPRAQGAAPSPAPSRAPNPGHWLILAEPEGSAAALAQRLGAQGDTCTLVYPEPIRSEGTAGARYVDPGDPAALGALVAEAMADERPLRGVVHLWSLGVRGAGEADLARLAHARTLGPAAVLPLVQALTAAELHPSTAPPRLWLVTRGAQAVGPEAMPAEGVARALLWGLGKTIALEHPEIWGGLIDLDPHGDPQETRRLLTEIREPDGEREIAFRQGVRQVARVVPAAEDIIPPHPYRPRPDGAYLVTGGLGGLGLQVARWLAEQGARRLILLGRTPLPPRAAWKQVADGPLAAQIQAVRQLEALGASVHTAAVDVGDEAQLRAFLSSYEEEGWPPIRGVVHAAGISQDVTLQGLDAAALDAVLHAKMRGGWLLHSLLQSAPLDFFVCFSSASSLTGSSRLGGYAAANAFLDALAHHRRGRQLPGLSINWGPWADIGMAAHDEVEEQRGRTGMGSILPRQGVELLGRLLRQDVPRLGVIPIAPNRLRQLFPADVSWLAELPLEPQFPEPADQERAGERILAAPGEERPGLMLSHLRQRIARITLSDPATIAAEHSVMQLGMDSLMIMQLIRELNRDLQLTLYPREIFERPSLDALAAYLLAELAGTNGATSGSARLAPPAEASEPAAVQPRRIANELEYALPTPLPPILPPSVLPPSRAPAGRTVEELPAIRPGPREGPLPLSFSQERFFFLDQLEPGAPTYVTPLAVRLAGTLNVAALEESLRGVLERHEALRTNLLLSDGTPCQEVAQLNGFKLPVDDLATVPQAEREARARQRIHDEVQRPFDLRSGPKLHARLLRLGDTEHVLVLTCHDIAVDGTSLSILVHELSALYEAFAAATPSPLPPLPIQYADYALWQRRHLEGAVLDAQLAYWKQQLAELQVLELPTDRPRPATRTHLGAGESRLLSARLSEMLLQLSRQENVTPFMTLLAAFQLLLSRLSGQEDVVVGTPIAGRHHPGTEGLIGVFLNNLALRTDLAGDPSFRELLARVRRTTLDAYANQDIPFERLIEELNPPRDLSRTPLFQVLFNMLPARGDQRLRFGAAIAEVVTDLERNAKFDFTLYVADGQRLRLELVYNTDLFEAARMCELLRQYERLLEQIVAAPEQAISGYNLLTAGAEAALPDPRLPLPPVWTGSIPARLAEQAQRAPAQLAVQDEQERWSYAELEEASNRLAHHLLAGGVQKGEIVAVYAHRSASLVPALLGVLRAGGAFLILDPAHPPARLLAQLRQAVPRAWLQLETAGEPPQELRALAEALPLQLTLPREKARLFALLAGDPPETPVVEIGPEDLAYVAFTSGTTGEPKGILGTHRPLSHFLEWHQRALALTTADRFSVLSGLAHDPLLRDLFTPLWMGATVCIPSDALRNEPRALLQWLQRERITVAHLTPAISEIIALGARGPAGEAEGARLPELRYACFGGDVLTLRQVARLRGLAPAARCISFYGATETPQAMAFREVAPEEDVAGAAAPEQEVPLGRGIEGVQLLVLGASDRPCGIGELGEICVRTPYLAQGYLGDPGLTAARFLSNPFTGEAHDRIYRTGDQGRYLADGSVAFAGRRDTQLKIRGYRVEPAEIEAALLRHPALRQAVVLGQDEKPGEQRLVAYLVIHEGEQVPAAGELREHLRHLLPDYMVPAAYVALERIPLTRNGKVDRRALLALEGEQADREAQQLTPRTPVEEVLAGIWQELLQVDRVGVHESFYDLGGHSLLAMQVVSRIRSALQIDLPLRTLFEAPTVADLAGRIEELQGVGTSPEAPPLVPVPRDEPLPLSFAQQRLWFLQQMEPQSTAYNMPVAVRLRGSLDPGALEWSLGEIGRRHESLRTTFRPVDGQPVQVIAPPQTFMLPVVSLESLAAGEREAEVRRRLMAEKHWAFDLAQGPLLRITLLRLASDEHVLLLNVHHSIADGVSMHVMAREVGALYAARCRGEPSPLPELEIQYGDYAVWQRQYLQGKVLAAQLSYWTEQLAELPLLQLPTDRPRPPVQTYRGATEWLVLPRALSEALKHLSQQEGATLFMTLLAAFKVLLSRLSGQEDVVVGSPIAGRTRKEIEGLIGVFLNNLVLRTDLSGDPSFRDLLARVREVTLGAYAHQEIPFEKLIEELRPPRDLSRTPFFQVLFNMLPVMGGEHLQLGGSNAEVLNPAEPDAKFDLTLYAAEQEEVQFRLVYNTDLFEAATIQRLLEYYRTLLEAIVTAPERRISTLPLLREGERQRLISRAERVCREVPFQEFPAEALEHAIGARFGEQVHKIPDAVAVATERYRWSYAELDRRANQVAQALLRQCGAGEARVALALQHDAPMVAGILGALKAGKTYVPLDSSFPAERLRYILEDAEATSVLTERVHAARVRGWAGEVPVLEIETAWEREATEAPELVVSPATAAYILYTSGSTGAPKGVVQNHRNVLHHIRTYVNRLHIGSEDRLSLLSSYGFDAAVMDVFGALLSGATLCPIDLRSEAAGDLPAQLVRSGVTVYHSTPTVYRQLMGQLRGEDLARIRLVVLGGEEVVARDVELFRRHLAPQALFVNGLGPTECTVALQYFMGHDTELPRGLVPVGDAVEGVEVQLLNEADEPVEVYATGEIVLRSPYVALGYWGRPEQTAAAFLSDPAGGERRLYRTGDLGRLLPDGSLAFVGRKDQQIKVRGYRIELGEIETRLLEHPAIEQAAVEVRDGAGAERQLVAYLVAREGQGAPPAGEMRERLRAKLPAYMVPANYVYLDRLPLTGSGKVDRRALLALQLGRPDPAADFVAPRTPLELLIAGIWQDLLGVERIGVQDNFFDLGGHSLLSVRFVTRLEEATGIRINLRELTYQTLGQVAAAHADQVAVQLPSRRTRLVNKLRRGLQWAISPNGH